MFYADVIKKFNSAQVKYAIVGGVAVNLHGYVRMTVDMDIILELEDKNLAKAVTIMRESGFTCKVPVDPIGLADTKTRQDWIENKNLKALNFYRKSEEVDFVIDTNVKYENVKISILSIRDIHYPIVSKEDLIKMKTGTGREKDKEDIRNLLNLIEIEKGLF